MRNIAIFASGNGTNAENIIVFFASHPNIRVSLIVSNKPDAFVLKRAENYHLPTLVIHREIFYNSNYLIVDPLAIVLKKYSIDFIVLAGFMWLIPVYMIDNFPNKIINIHPALLPKYGGKGMYGNKVHSAVIDNGETESGITIHYVNRHYDQGKIIFQAKCKVSAGDTPETLAEKVHRLEYQHYPVVIEQLVSKHCQ